MNMNVLEGFVAFNKTNLRFSNLIHDVIKNGSVIDSRNSETKRIRNHMITFDQTPLITLRRTAWKSALYEMEWFLSGSNNTNDLNPMVRKWWKPWADSDGTVENNYSCQFRNFHGRENSIDQIDYMMSTIISEPQSRRNVITTWNTSDMVSVKTPITNCHGTVIQAFVEPDNKLHITMYQRSCDVILGLPHNWVQYWALLLWLAHNTKKEIGTFTWVGGDCHIYKDHYGLAEKMGDILYDSTHPIDIPNLIYKPKNDSLIFNADDFELDCKYEPILKESAKMVI